MTAHVRVDIPHVVFSLAQIPAGKFVHDRSQSNNGNMSIDQKLSRELFGVEPHESPVDTSRHDTTCHPMRSLESVRFHACSVVFER